MRSRRSCGSAMPRNMLLLLLTLRCVGANRPATLSFSAADRPALPQPAGQRVHLVARAEPRQQPRRSASWLSALKDAPPWAQHDYANLALLPLLSGLAIASLRTERAQLPLAALLLAYMVLDALWLIVQPSVVKTTTVLLWHHAVAVGLIVHAATHAPHRRYVAWMSIVEVNTFFLVLRRHLQRRWVEASFVLTWLLIRVAWFPYLPLHFLFFLPEPWPAGLHGTVARVGVSGGALGLAVLQLVWTKRQLGGMLRRWWAARQADGEASQAMPAWL